MFQRSRVGEISREQKRHGLQPANLIISAKFSIFIYDFHARRATSVNGTSERNFIRDLSYWTRYSTHETRLCIRPRLSSQGNAACETFATGARERAIFSISAPFSFVRERAWKFSILGGKVLLATRSMSFSLSARDM